MKYYYVVLYDFLTACPRRPRPQALPAAPTVAAGALLKAGDIQVDGGAQFFGKFPGSEARSRPLGPERRRGLPPPSPPPHILFPEAQSLIMEFFPPKKFGSSHRQITYL